MKKKPCLHCGGWTWKLPSRVKPCSHHSEQWRSNLLSAADEEYPKYPKHSKLQHCALSKTQNVGLVYQQQTRWKQNCLFFWSGHLPALTFVITRIKDIICLSNASLAGKHKTHRCTTLFKYSPSCHTHTHTHTREGWDCVICNFTLLLFFFHIHSSL